PRPIPFESLSGVATEGRYLAALVAEARVQRAVREEPRKREVDEVRIGLISAPSEDDLAPDWIAMALALAPPSRPSPNRTTCRPRRPKVSSTEPSGLRRTAPKTPSAAVAGRSSGSD